MIGSVDNFRIHPFSTRSAEVAAAAFKPLTLSPCGLILLFLCVQFESRRANKSPTHESVQTRSN